MRRKGSCWREEPEARRGSRSGKAGWSVVALTTCSVVAPWADRRWCVRSRGGKGKYVVLDVLNDDCAPGPSQSARLFHGKERRPGRDPRAPMTSRRGVFAASSAFQPASSRACRTRSARTTISSRMYGGEKCPKSLSLGCEDYGTGDGVRLCRIGCSHGREGAYRVAALEEDDREDAVDNLGCRRLPDVKVEPSSRDRVCLHAERGQRLPSLCERRREREGEGRTRLDVAKEEQLAPALLLAHKERRRVVALSLGTPCALPRSRRGMRRRELLALVEAGGVGAVREGEGVERERGREWELGAHLCRDTARAGGEAVSKHPEVDEQRETAVQARRPPPARAPRQRAPNRNSLFVVVRPAERHRVIPPAQHGPHAAVHEALNVCDRALDAIDGFRGRTACGRRDDEAGDVVEVGVGDGEAAARGCVRRRVSRKSYARLVSE